jgi:hypothetical protein
VGLLYAAFNAGRRDGGRWSWAIGPAVIALVAVGWQFGHDTYNYAVLTPFVWAAGRAVRERELVAAR